MQDGSRFGQMKRGEDLSRNRRKCSKGLSTSSPKQIRESPAIRKSGGINAMLVYRKLGPERLEDGIEELQVPIAELPRLLLPPRLHSARICSAFGGQALHVNHDRFRPAFLKPQTVGS